MVISQSANRGNFNVNIIAIITLLNKINFWRILLMANEIQMFNNEVFGNIRVLEENGNVLFCGMDVATALGYSKPRNAISAHCPHALKRGVRVETGKKADGTPAIQYIEMSFIPEPDLYRLTFGSKLPTAEQFTDWVTEEILPSVRKHGAYMTPETIEKVLTNPDFIIGLATQLKEEQEKRKQLEAQIEQEKPLVDFAHGIIKSKDNILIRDYAKILCDDGFNVGEKRLYSYLRDNQYLNNKNLPYQKYIDAGYFFVKESTYMIPNNQACLSQTTLITPKGQLWLYKKIKDEPIFSK